LWSVEAEIPSSCRHVQLFTRVEGSVQGPMMSWRSCLLLCFGLIVAACGRAPESAATAPAPILATPVVVKQATPTLARAGAATDSAGTLPLVPTPPAAGATEQTVPDIGDPYTPGLGATGFDVQHYTLRFALDPAIRHVSGEATLEIASRQDPLTELWLDLIGYEVRLVEIDGIAAEFRRVGDKLQITLPHGRLAGSSFQVNVQYEGRPTAYRSPFIPLTHLGFHYPDAESEDGALFAFSEPDGARAWFPANDHPRDKATFRFELTVPAGLTAVANGRLVRETASGAVSEFVWEHNYPMAPYLATIAVGEYVRLDSVAENDVPLRHYIAPESLANFEAYAGVNEAALAWLSERLGPYPFETYGYVTVPLEGVSMETQTMVLLSDTMIGARTMVHEMAHMWFGNWVSLDSWADMWRNEGFATYLQLLWEYRDDPEGLASEMAGIEAAVTENGETYPLGDPPPARLFSFETYFEGALFVHELRLTMGDVAFWSGLRAYMDRYGGGTASRAEFQAVMEEAAGRSLSDLFTSWLD
jgi:aminopeptidase N